MNPRSIMKWIHVAQLYMCVANGGGFDGDMLWWLRAIGGASGTG